MRRILLVLMTTVAAVVTLFGYRTSTPHPGTAPATVVAAGSTDTGAAAGSSAVAPVPQPTAPTGGSGTAKTVAGDAAQTRWGPVQVQITVTGARITAVSLLQVPDGNGRDVEINGYAVPILKQETLKAQSATIDAVSGATVTSGGYVTSLQSAIDRAGL